MYLRQFHSTLGFSWKIFSIYVGPLEHPYDLEEAPVAH